MQSPSKASAFGQTIGLLAALIVIICFFIPWIEVGASFLKVGVSGWQLASGAGPAEVKVPGVVSLWLVPLSMLLTLGLTAVSLLAGNRTTSGARGMAVWLILLGAVSAAVMLYNYFDLNRQFSHDLMGMLAQNLVSYASGWTASLVGSFAVLVGGVIDLGLNKRA
jgi:hypothetical protein